MKLFKYTDLNTLKLILENNSLLFRSPRDFNDPYDCQLPFDFNNSEKEVLDYFKYLRNRKRHLPLDKIFNRLPDNWKEMSEDEVIELHAIRNSNNDVSLRLEADEAINEIITNMGVCCFSKDSKNILMWSHYSDMHKGVCLEFEIEYDKNIFFDLIEIEYVNRYDKFNILREQENKGEFKKYMVGLKSKDWKYEDEIRSIKTTNGLHKFKPNALTGIIFGLKSSEVERTCIESFCKNKIIYNHICFYKAKKIDGIFEIGY